ncbi:hydroxymethylbilane synthase [Legionella waltersii]|uniref:Porphobilinogen deaminase n=1 Tax=Legionella waltersii TaxID=66969 RepID=A0A0W1ADD0_9GAMM|nr:hydroxymethylbilane synthase [Legionella waltersii]KTD79337.1 porphobilinogen deaminase [Legionella waltersii]SNV13117.1 porphobilinogen deaminase [Legionella waltersii]
MHTKTVRIATRQSPLALWQANFVKQLLLEQFPSMNIELLPMVTSGDKFLKDKLLEKGGKGLFVKELEEALLDKRADLAVHSTKDMPAELPDGLCLAAICERHNPFDAFVSNNHLSLNALPSNAIIGTSSLRRQSQLLAHRPDLQIKTLRGNINTRLSKLDNGEYDAIILAAAGLERMGFNQRVTEILSDNLMLPACGQGALCIETRENDSEINQIINPLNDPITSICVNAERQVNALLGGNCHVPLAVFCTQSSSDSLLLRAKILSQDGAKVIYDKQEGGLNNVDELAKKCTEALLSQGAKMILNTVSL